ncbi:MAG: magnesium transporter, partial [Oscillospiraceae bacterium]|nr:magnesium transporter [Oscillospiraceae bacterium]
AEEDRLIAEVMSAEPISAKTSDDQEAVATLFSRYGIHALPVVDHEDRIVGIVTVDDAIDILEEEATEDIEKMAAIAPSDKPYMRMSVFEIWRSRIPWLLILMASATFTGLIITSFESALAAQVALTAFIPMLMGSGGNSGSQASVTIIRAISLGELGFRDILSVMWKETRVSFFCGLVLAAANFLKILLVDMLWMGRDGVTVVVALVVSAALALTVLFAKIVGSAMPLLAKRIGFDPAVMASPFITTIVDAVSLIIYFQIATAVLRL